MMRTARVSTRLPRVRVLASLLVTVMAATGWIGNVSLAFAEQMSAGAGSVVDPSLEAYLPTVGLKGKLVVVGSDTMQQLLSRFAGEFKKWYPSVTVSIETEGSAAGFGQFLEWSSGGRDSDGAGGAMILASSKALGPEKVKEFVSKVGYPPIELQVALGAVAIYVHEENPLRQLTLQQLDAMYGVSRKRGGAVDITRWGQLGLKGEWEQQPIHLYGRDELSGTRTLFQREALLDGEYKTGVREEPGVTTLVLAVSNDPLGIGYAGVLYEQYHTVRVVPLAEKPGKPFVAPNADAVREGLYPLSRKLYIYMHKAPSREMVPLVREFLKFAHSREGQQMVVLSGFVTVPVSLLSQNLAMLGKRPDAK